VTRGRHMSTNADTVPHRARVLIRRRSFVEEIEFSCPECESQTRHEHRRR
jgi:hypothetical protein